MKYTLTQQAIEAIEKVLSKGDRIEIIPSKNSEVKIIHIQRKEVRAKL